MGIIKNSGFLASSIYRDSIRDSSENLPIGFPLGFCGRSGEKCTLLFSLIFEKAKSKGIKIMDSAIQPLTADYSLDS